MTQRIPNFLQPLLDTYGQLLARTSFANAVHGVYLIGSLSLGAYEEQTSDIDFLTVLTRELNEVEREELGEVHTCLQAKHRIASKMDGMYVCLSDLGRQNEEMRPYCYTHEGEFRSAGYWDINHVTWWLLKHRAINITGPESATLPFQVTEEDLLATMSYNLNGYWSRRIREMEQLDLDAMPERLVRMETADAVLTLCRITYTLREREVISKLAALHDALRSAEPRWHPLLRETQFIRERSAERVPERSEFASTKEYATVACDFIRSILDADQQAEEGGR